MSRLGQCAAGGVERTFTARDTLSVGVVAVLDLAGDVASRGGEEGDRQQTAVMAPFVLDSAFETSALCNKNTIDFNLHGCTGAVIN